MENDHNYNNSLKHQSSSLIEKVVDGVKYVSKQM